MSSVESSLSTFKIKTFAIQIFPLTSAKARTCGNYLHFGRNLCEDIFNDILEFAESTKFKNFRLDVSFVINVKDIVDFKL